MEVERQEACGGRDMASLDLDLLQLSELSPFALREKPSLAETLFRQWLSLPETSKSVKTFPPSPPSSLAKEDSAPWIWYRVEKLGLQKLVVSLGQG